MQLDDLDGLMQLRRFVEVAHHIPGRIRLKFTNRLVAGLSRYKLGDLESLCHPQGCLQSFSLNDVTHSLTIGYQARRLSPALLNQLFGPDNEAAQQALEHIHAILEQDRRESL